MSIALQSDKKQLYLNLAVAWLGWMFDGMEMGLYSLIAVPALKELLHTQDTALIGPYVGFMFALFLLGASMGGLIFGRLGDKIGRVKTMIVTVLVYSVFTGLSALAETTWQFGVCRFLGAMGLGGEWGLGVALVMETWPDKKRPLLAGALGASANVGFLLSSLIGLFAGTFGWRVLLLSGLVPAVLTFFIRLYVKEPERWKQAKERGEKPDMGQLWRPPLRRRTVLACIISSVVIVGTWGVFQWIPSWVNTLTGGDATHQRATAAMFMAFGQIIGAFAGGPMADWLGRRWSYAIFCVTSLIASIALYSLVTSYGTTLLLLAIVAGICSTAFFGWLPLYLPELFPTRIRATGEGITYNFGRILAAIGVFMGTGKLVSVFHGSFAKAGTVMASVYLIGLLLIWTMPETKGQRLPE
jgi:MFS transporter, SHS family, sialic acid transporter